VGTATGQFTMRQAELTSASREKLFAEFDAKAPANPASVAQCQSHLKFRLPADYVQFLEQMNGGDRINEKRRDADPAKHKDMQIHEIHPVKFGGHPTDSENKIVLPVEQHRLLNGWWYRRQLSLERGGSKGSSKSGRSTRGRSTRGRSK
jgi:hypothetical protein